MHGLETIVKLNATYQQAQTTTPCEADELKDIAQLVAKCRGGMHTWLTLTAREGERIADYLVAAYGIQE